MGGELVHGRPHPLRTENLHRPMFPRKQSGDDQRGVDVSTPPDWHDEHLEYGLVVEALLGERRIRIA